MLKELYLSIMPFMYIQINYFFSRVSVQTFRRIRFCISLSEKAFFSLLEFKDPCPWGFAVKARSSSIFSLISVSWVSFVASGVDRPPTAPIANTLLFERNNPVAMLNSSCKRFFSTCWRWACWNVNVELLCVWKIIIHVVKAKRNK